MNEYQITFLVDDPVASAHIAKPMLQLDRKFKSQIRLINITRKRSADLSRSMAWLQAGLQKGDLCQIAAIGMDAELTCFVIKDMIAEHFTLIGSRINYEFSASLAKKLPNLILPCRSHWYYAKAHTELTKFDCLKGLAKLIHPSDPDALILSFIRREERSPTSVAKGIALPHVMFEGIEQLSIAVISSEAPIDWASKMGHVHLAIALVLPLKPEREQIVAATNLTRSMLCEEFAGRLLMTRSSVDLQALLMYAMSGALL